MIANLYFLRICKMHKMFSEVGELVGEIIKVNPEVLR